MIFSIIINPKSPNSNAIDHALHFIESSLKNKKSISNIFIYGHAVEMLLKTEENGLKPWIKIGHSGVDISLCSTIADSVLDNNNFNRPKNNDNLMDNEIKVGTDMNTTIKSAILKTNSPFKLAGLGLWMESIFESDRTIEFV